MTSQTATDYLGRELCRICDMPLPSDSLVRELHLIRHTLDELTSILEWLTREVGGIRHEGIPSKSRRWE